IDRDGLPFDKGRAEEWKALNVIPVRMSEENARRNGSLALGHQLGGQPVRAGAAVKNQKVAVGSGQLDARGIAAEVVCARPGGGDRPPRSPDTYSHEAVAPLREASFTETILTTTGFIDCSLLLAVVAHLKFGHMAQICP